MRTSRYLFALFLLLPISAAAQPTALAELFRNFGCNNCEPPDSAYGYYLSKHPGVVLINYHNSIPYQEDPFYKASASSVNVRNQFYSVQANPTAFIDGVFAGNSQASEPQWENNTTGAIALSSHLSPISNISISQNNGVDSIHFTVNGSSNTQVRYYVAIKESKIAQANNDQGGYGLPPGGLWNDVFRTMLPNGNGSTPFTLSGSHSFVEAYDPSKYFYQGVPENMTAVIFVQDVNPVPGVTPTSYQVEAIDTIPLSSSSAVAEAAPISSRLSVSSNPLGLRGHIGFELPNAAHVQISESDMLGRNVRTLFDGEAPSGQTSIEMSSSLIPPGCYIIRMSVDGNIVDVEKFVVSE